MGRAGVWVLRCFMHTTAVQQVERRPGAGTGAGMLNCFSSCVLPCRALWSAARSSCRATAPSSACASSRADRAATQAPVTSVRCGAGRGRGVGVQFRPCTLSG